MDRAMTNGTSKVRFSVQAVRRVSGGVAVASGLRAGDAASKDAAQVVAEKIGNDHIVHK